MNHNDSQWPAQRKIKDHKIISNLDVTRKHAETGKPVASVTIGREMNLLHEEGTPHPVKLQGPDRMSGSGTAKEMGEIFKGIAAMRPKDN